MSYRYYKLETLSKSDSKSFWRSLKSLKTVDSQSENPIPISQWLTHFQKLRNKNTEEFDLKAEETKLSGNTCIPDALGHKITKTEVISCIKNLKNNKQPGLDMIPNEFIKFSSAPLMDILVKFFNKILDLDSGKFPDQWNVSSLTVIHKSGDINDCNNYRGISLSSSLSKLFTTLLQKRLQKFVDDNNLLTDYQAGFRPDHHTVDHLYTLKTLINKYVYKDKKPIYAVFIDFSKAFDSVWRQ